MTNLATNATDLFTSGASSGFFAFRASNTSTGNGLFGGGGDSGSGNGGSGVRAHGGGSGWGTGGVGVSALGGLSNSGTGGDGVIAQGGDGQPAGRGLWSPGGFRNSGSGPGGIGVLGEGGAGFGGGPTGAGVRGESASGSGVEGSSTSGRGVHGSSGSGAGVEGNSGANFGIVGTSTSSAGLSGLSVNGEGILALNQNANKYALVCFSPNANTFGAFIRGRLVVEGQKNSAIRTSKGLTLLRALETPEPLFEDIGTEQLRNGRARVDLDATFLETEVTKECQVFLTPRSAASKGLAVTTHDSRGFTVQELEGGTGSYGFDWRLVARRKDARDEPPLKTTEAPTPGRLPRVPNERDEESELPDGIPSAPPASPRRR